MNYINNPLEMCCCSFASGEGIRVERKTMLVDVATNKPCDFTELALGHRYDCVERWVLIKNYTLIAEYPTDDEARAAYNDLIAEIAEKNTVFSVTGGKRCSMS